MTVPTLGPEEPPLIIFASRIEGSLTGSQEGDRLPAN